MRRTIVIAVLVLTMVSIALGQRPSASSDYRTGSIEQAIRQLDHERIQAQIAADAAVLERIYGNTGVETGRSTMNGQDRGKAGKRRCRPCRDGERFLSRLARA
jgi:hypothetical protein